MRNKYLADIGQTAIPWHWHEQERTATCLESKKMHSVSCRVHFHFPKKRKSTCYLQILKMASASCPAEKLPQPPSGGQEASPPAGKPDPRSYTSIPTLGFIRMRIICPSSTYWAKLVSSPFLTKSVTHCPSSKCPSSTDRKFSWLDWREDK